MVGETLFPSTVEKYVYAFAKLQVQWSSRLSISLIFFEGWQEDGSGTRFPSIWSVDACSSAWDLGGNGLRGSGSGYRYHTNSPGSSQVWLSSLMQSR